MKGFLSILLVSAILFSSCGKHIKQPEYRNVSNIRVIELGPLQSTAGADITYYNPNGFGVQVESAQGDIYVDSSFFGKLELSDKVSVKRKSEFTLPALIRIDMLSVIKNQRSILKKKEALVRITGTATIKKAGFEKEIPIQYEKMQDIDKFKGLISH
jgi:LEA14-like dessication related protein